MHDPHPPGHIFNILTNNNNHTKASIPFLYLLVCFSKPSRSNETIASFSTRNCCLVALRTALIDTAVDLRKAPATENCVYALKFIPCYLIQFNNIS